MDRVCSSAATIIRNGRPHMERSRPECNRSITADDNRVNLPAGQEELGPAGNNGQRRSLERPRSAPGSGSIPCEGEEVSA